MTINPRRFAGALVSALLLGGALYYWRSGDASQSTTEISPPERGGEIVAAIRADPRSFNRLVVRDEPSDLVAQLTQARLVRINRSTFELEPWLAERWEASEDQRVFTLHLRNVTWSDGTPFTSADVLFTFDAIADPKSDSVLTDSIEIAGQPIRVAAPDDRTVTVTLPAASGLGLRILDGVPILPRHKLATALADGTFAKAWSTSTPPSELAGLGPFVISRYESGQRVILDRNPRYWRKAPDGSTLPYLDRVVLEIVPEQNAALVRLQAGSLDMTQNELRPEDYRDAKRAEDEGRLEVAELGVGTDADAFWFLLKPEAKKSDPRFAFVQKREFRQALSHAVDREEYAQSVFLGAAVPIWGPVTPGNKPWFSPNVPRYPPDMDKARELLRSIGLEDRNHNGIAEDAAGTEARFTVITQRGVTSYERGAAILRDRAGEIGVQLDLAPLDFAAMIQRMLASDYDAIFMRPLLTDLDPAASLDFWLSSGSAHVWNLEQRAPATEWEKRIDTLMMEQAATVDPQRRRALFDDVQRILGENVPVLYFAAPRLYYAYSSRLRGVVPSIMRPPVLWNADQLSVTGPARAQ